MKPAEVDILERPDKRCKAEKTKKLGGTPKQRREQIRATPLRPGYYVCESGKTRMRILHQLGSCWMVPGVDYFSFVHHGTRRPFSRNLYQGLQVVRLKGNHKGIR